MSSIAPVTILTGRRAEHRECFAQIGHLVIITNGHGPNQVYDTRRNTCQDVGMSSPGAAPTDGGSIAGALVGAYRWRARWWDSNTKTASLASAELSLTLATEGRTITFPGSPPARATHVIIERTVRDGKYFYPVNRDSSSPDGSLISAGSYNDTLSDDTINVRNSIENNQGRFQPYQWCAANGPRMFFGGGIIHRPTVTLTNASKAVTSTDGGFTADMVGWNLGRLGDGRTYKIASYTNANRVDLEENYAGTTGTVAVAIAGQLNKVGWSETDSPEYGGSAEIGVVGFSNELLVGDSGRVTAGCGLGPTGFLYAKESQLHLHSYFVDPKIGIGDGRLVQLQTLHGACGAKCMRFIDGSVYGIDYRGIWRWEPGSPKPTEIHGSIAYDFAVGGFNFSACENWHIGHDPYHQHVYFFISEGSDTYPKKAYVWDLERQDWVDRPTFPAGITSTFEMPDATGALRMNVVQEAVGNAPSREFFHGIGTSMGANPASVLVGTVTAGGAATLTAAAASFYNSDQKLKGVAVTLVRAADASEETRIIVDNTDTQLTIDGNWTGAQPVAGDTYRLGPMESKWRTGRIAFGASDRKKEFYELWIWAENKTPCVSLYLNVYYDNSSTPESDWMSRAEDGVTFVANSPNIKIDPTTSGQKRFRIPLMRKDANDITLEFFSHEAGEPWEVLDAVLVANVDPDQQAREE